jgi:HSP20 family protein
MSQMETHNGHDKTTTLARPQPGELMRRAGFSGGFEPLQALADEMDALFDSFGLGRTGLGRPLRSQRLRDAGWTQSWSPPLEVEERDGQLLVRADLPGIKKGDVKVSLDDDVLTITGERRDEHEEKSAGTWRSERSYGSFCRTVALPAGVDADQINAHSHEGVLEVTMPAPQASVSHGRAMAVED